jgi:archaemetzincin
MVEIQIVPVGDVDGSVIEYLSLTLQEGFNARCKIRGLAVDPAFAYSASRRQYHSTEILGRLLELEIDEAAKILGVADVDLFIPILTFVFGEAQCGGRAAVMSLSRLRQQFYGLPPDDRLLYERCEKEAAHELGHAFGLGHCRSFECVMHSSNSVEQVDLKLSNPCPDCCAALSKLRNGEARL